ncbi:hypothetical protein ES319_D13G113800v1 [Gossypium barbadense]|uniref:Uncharacterized protein n=1 Tax=Gossypium barbadense TaxID=3634 RepID=A0A5J5NPK8_GOSBA|nr:hypothetical protein ES319_D13G113800v1 [Gossypium barbadense]
MSINHHHMRHGNWWYSLKPQGPQPHSSRRTWQHMADHQVSVHSTFNQSKEGGLLVTY